MHRNRKGDIGGGVFVAPNDLLVACSKSTTIKRNADADSGIIVRIWKEPRHLRIESGPVTFMGNKESQLLRL